MLNGISSRLTVAAAISAATAFGAATQGEADFFEKRIRPVLVERCAACHGENLQTAGLNLTTAEGFYKGGESGPLYREDEPESSRLLVAVRYEGQVKMPPTGKLPNEEIEALTAWIKRGAVWPNADPHATVQDLGAEPQWSDGRTEHWAFKPVQDQEPPSVKDEDWVQTPVDRYILARLEEEGLAPAPQADRLTLLRRAKYDLHGLAPSEAEIREFLADESRGAFRRLVDRLLGSPRYGEKWGRHWLDVARYADSTGLDDDIKVPYTWRYRDYVVDAINGDTPFDQFIAEQLAGDLLPADGADEVNRRGVIATGFLAVGTKPLVQQDKIKMKYDTIDEQIDTTAKVFMGLTMGCARCHDHKFDPISAKDYYSMASIFASVKNFESLDPAMTVSKVHLEPLVPEATYSKYKNHQDQIGNTRQRIAAITDAQMYRHVLKYRSPDLARYMLAAHEVYNDGADVDLVAARERLDCEILRLWVDYLKPGEELRLHLKQWYDADDSTRGPVAEEYQQRFQSRGLEWAGLLDEWREEIDAWDGTGKFPTRPNLAPGSDRFFSEVTLPAKSQDEGATAVDGPFAVHEQSMDSILPSDQRKRVEVLRKELERQKESAPAKPEMAYAIKQVESVNQHVFVRGNHKSLGAPVPKAFPAVLTSQDLPPIESQSGRLELAQWLASEDHPLTSRVIANRIWQWHFGQGLVRTPNNFGLMGEKPTHPELLDYLARRFRHDSWSLKGMHRLIMLSSTYQMQSHISDEAWSKDSGNRLWSRFNRRRLTVEEMRDSLLGIDGTLDLAVGGAVTENLNSYGFKEAYVHPDDTRRRTVYLPIYRNRMPTMLTLFDFADPSASVGARPKTSVAPQGLYFMNSAFVQERARALASRLVEMDAESDSARIKRAYSIALTRDPDAEEVDGMLDYVARYPVGEGTPQDRIDGWQSLCRLLLTSNEYNFVN